MRRQDVSVQSQVVSAQCRNVDMRTFCAEKLGKFRRLTQIAYFVKDFDARVDLSEDQIRQPPAKLKTRQQDQRRQRLGLSRLAKAASLCFPIRYWRPIRVKRLL